MSENLDVWVLVVDDDDKLRALLASFLQEHGYTVRQAADVAEARAQLSAQRFQAVLLDVMMPGERGTVLAAELRAAGGPPVLHLSALGDGEDRIAGLEAGAQDYLAKPFLPKELLLRLQNLLERTSSEVVAPSTRIAFGPFLFDRATGQLTKRDEPVYLTSAEQECLKILAATPGEAVSRDMLASLIPGGANSRSADVQINRLRKKIEAQPSRPVYIQTIRHTGYALISDPHA